MKAGFKIQRSVTEMRSRKMTNALRDAIERAVLGDKYPASVQTALEELLGKDLRDNMHLIEGWEKYRVYIYVRTSVWVTTKTHGSLNVPVEEFPCERISSPTYVSEKDLTSKGREILKRLTDFLDRREAFRSDVWAVLRQANTTKQLIDTIPEFAKYLPEDDRASLLPVPVEKISQLRRALTADS